MNILDKITLYTIDFNKEISYEEIPKGCSGSISYNANECDEYMIYKITETKETEFGFETVLDYYGDVEKEQGINEFNKVEYHLISLNKKTLICNELELKNLSSEYRKKSYENHLKQIKRKLE